jgi:selenocysteine lyase/cysteine desulfurase
MLGANGLTTARISAHVAGLQERFVGGLDGTVLDDAELLNPLGDGPHARFLAFRSPRAQEWYAALSARNCLTDVRGNVLRVGFGLYQDENDIDRLLGLLSQIQVPEQQ